jgi:hypothetical protein
MKTKPKPKPTTNNGRDEAGRFRRGQAPPQKPTPTLVVERVNLHTLHEDPSNPNTHPENDIKDLMAKLATFRQVEPLVVQKSTRKVIGGNGRLEAMRRLGWTQCDVTFVDCDNVTATALGISLNRRKSLMDDSALVAQLQAIQSENADLMDAVGYDQGEIDALIAGLSNVPGPEADGKEYDESVADEVKYLECPECHHKWPA